MTNEKLENLRAAVQDAMQELADDALQYLELLEHLKEIPVGSEERPLREAELEVQITVLKAHTLSLSDLLDTRDDAYVADEESA